MKTTKEQKLLKIYEEYIDKVQRFLPFDYVDRFSDLAIMDRIHEMDKQIIKLKKK